jgi:hypothetical protein
MIVSSFKHVFDRNEWQLGIIGRRILMDTFFVLDRNKKRRVTIEGKFPERASEWSLFESLDERR